MQYYSNAVRTANSQIIYFTIQTLCCQSALAMYKKMNENIIKGLSKSKRFK